jgi:FAD synthase
MRVIEWEDFIAQRPGAEDRPLAITIGVFDGVHRGHAVLLERIVSVPGALPTVVTFRQNPLAVLRPREFPGDIFTVEQKLRIFEETGVAQTVLIDFSPQFSKTRGRDFIDLLIKPRPVRLLALGPNFRCGYRMDTGVQEIRARAMTAGVETWTACPVMEGGRPVSSSRVRQAIASGRIDEASLLLGRPADAVLKNFQV